MRVEANPPAPQGARLAHRLGALPPELQQAIVAEADLTTFASSLRSSHAMRDVFDTPAAHRRALLRAGLDPSWVQASDPAQLRRRVHAEAGWREATGYAAHGGLLLLDPLGRGLRNRPHLRHASCAPNGENVAFFGEDDYRVHLLRLGLGASHHALPSFALPHEQRPTATAMDRHDRLFVATESGAVFAYALRSGRPTARPAPLGHLDAGPPWPQGPSHALASVAGGAALVGLHPAGLSSWAVGSGDDAGPPSYCGLRPSATATPWAGADPLVRLTTEADAALLAASTASGQVALVVGGEATLLHVGTLAAPDAPPPTDQAVRLAQRGRTLARLEADHVALFDLRRSLRAASARLALPGRLGRPTVLAPLAEAGSWTVGGQDGELAGCDVRQPRKVLWRTDLRDRKVPRGLGRVTELAPAPDGRGLVAAVAYAPSGDRPARGELASVPLDAAGTPSSPTYYLWAEEERFAGLQWLAQGDRLLVHSERVLLVWRPEVQGEPRRVVEKALRAADADHERIGVGPATERSATRRSYASVVRHTRQPPGLAQAEGADLRT